MLKKMKTNEGIQYKKLSPEEMKARGILGRLIGPCADFNKATRNGRKYSEELWENVFNNPIMQEKIKNGVCFGELGHPEDRTEVDMEKIAVCLREQPVKNEKGQLCAVFDILDTPNGRILKTLCDYGSTVGVSSRGQGDIITDRNGDEAVDPDTYECECWDIVLVPAVESARMTYVKEGLENKQDKKLAKMKKVLSESLNKASDEDKKIMKETLDELNIDLNEDTNTSDNDSSNVVETPVTVNEEKPNEETLDDEEYAELTNRFIGDVPNMNLEEVKNWFFDEYQFDKLPPADEMEEKIFNALKARLDELNENVTESLTEDADDEDEKAEQEEPAEEEVPEELPVEFTNDEELPVEDDVAIAEIPEEPVDDTTLEIEEEPVDERTDKEIFLDYLMDNFDEKQIKKACKALDIEVPEKEDKEEDEKEEDEEKEAEEEAPVEEPVEGEPEAEEEAEEECNDESCSDKEEEANEVVEESVEAIDNGDAELLRNLQEALKGKSDLEGSVKSLQEKLAVSDTKVNELTEEANRYKKAVARLATISKSNKDLKESVSKLEESLKEKDATIEEQKSRIARLVKSRKESVSESLSLNESVATKTSEINNLTESLNKANDEVKALNEKLTNQTKESESKVSELNENLNKATTLKEAYKKLANKTVNKYIELKATTLGLTSADIKRKLGESYSLDDVDQVCEDLKAYQLNVSKLPFSIDRKVGVRVNESAPRLTKKTTEFDDDEVDESLIKLAGGIR